MAEPTLQPHDRIGPWLLVRRLGQGGMGTVFEGIHEETRARAAVKVVVRELASDPRYRERFLREAKLAREVSHRNLVACLDAGEDQGRLYLALELVSGGSLAERVKKGALPWSEVARIGGEIARGLEALHAAGIVHRDLKPSNVLLSGDGRAKVSDLGLARAEGLLALTKTGELLGTLEYMAPEQAEGGASVNARSDLYSLGCTLYGALLGRPPFPGSGPMVIVKHLNATPEPLRGQVEGLPEELERIVLRLLEKVPARRGPSAGAVAAELEKLDPSSRSRSSSAGRVLAAIVLGGVVLLGVLIETLRPPPSAPPETRRETVHGTAPPAPAPPTVRQEGPRPDDPFQAAKPDWYRQRETEGRRLPSSLPRGVYYDKKRDNVYWNAKDRSQLIFIPGGLIELGRAHLGAQHSNAMSPVQLGPDRGEVELAPFFLGRYELSNEQFQRFVNATKFVTEAEKLGKGYVLDGVGRGETVPGAQWRHPAGPGESFDPGCPVVHVTWEDARSYLAWAGLRLPTEAEWECGAAWDGTAMQDYPWRDGGLTDEVAEKADALDKPGPHLVHVDAHPAGASPWGALNMAGNVREWVQEAEGPHAHVVKGGSFNEGPENLRPSFHSNEAVAANNLGFRVALDAGSSR